LLKINPEYFTKEEKQILNKWKIQFKKLMNFKTNNISKTFKYLNKKGIILTKNQKETFFYKLI
jgi:hypothetical protein